MAHRCGKGPDPQRNIVLVYCTNVQYTQCAFLARPSLASWTGGSRGTRGWFLRPPCPPWSGYAACMRSSCALARDGASKQTMSPGAHVSRTMTAVRQTVPIGTVVDGVVRLARGATTGTCHGTVPVRLVVPTPGPEHGARRSHWQRMRGTTSGQDDPGVPGAATGKCTVRE